MRGLRKAGLALGVLGTLTAAGALALAGCQSLGEHASGERLARIEQSPQWQGDRFANAQAMWSDLRNAFLHVLSGGPDVEPTGPVPVVRTDPAVLAVAPASGLRVTWFGHSWSWTGGSPRAWARSRSRWCPRATRPGA